MGSLPRQCCKGPAHRSIHSSSTQQNKVSDDSTTVNLGGYKTETHDQLQAADRKTEIDVTEDQAFSVVKHDATEGRAEVPLISESEIKTEPGIQNFKTETETEVTPALDSDEDYDERLDIHFNN